jgi:hypothetical protein
MARVSDLRSVEKRSHDVAGRKTLIVVPKRWQVRIENGFRVALAGKDRDLCSVADTELAHNLADMHFDRRFRHIEIASNALVGQAVPEQARYLHLAAGERSFLSQMKLVLRGSGHASDSMGAWTLITGRNIRAEQDVRREVGTALEHEGQDAQCKLGIHGGRNTGSGSGVIGRDAIGTAVAVGHNDKGRIGITTQQTTNVDKVLIRADRPRTGNVNDQPSIRLNDEFT